VRIVIDQLRSGRWRVRAENAKNGRLVPVGPTHGTQEQAAEVRRHLREIETDRRKLASRTLSVGSLVETWLRSRSGKGAAADRRRAEQHILSDPIATRRVTTISQRDVRGYLDRLGDKRAQVRGPGRAFVDSSRTISTKTQREAFVLFRSALGYAVELEIIQTNPSQHIPLPGSARTKALPYLYPDEEATLVSSEAVPLPYRLLYGFLAREGMRKSEALRLTWDDVDLARGIVRLDENKSDDPRAWALRSDVIRALSWWRESRSDDSDRVFLGSKGKPLNTLRAHRLRAHLRRAGVTRAELYETTPSRQAIRVHDLRGTFVTLSLAAGKTETWVQDRTGHTTNAMLQRYRRQARTAAEVGLGDLEPLDALIRGSDPRDGGHGVDVSEIERLFGAGHGTRTGDAHQFSPVDPDTCKSRGSIADPTRVLIAAVRGGQDAAAHRACLDIARAVEDALGPALGLAQQVRSGDPRWRIRRTVELLRELDAVLGLGLEAGEEVG